MKIENVEKHIANIHGKSEYVIKIQNLKQALSYGLFFIEWLNLIKVLGKRDTLIWTQI